MVCKYKRCDVAFHSDDNYYLVLWDGGDQCVSVVRKNQVENPAVTAEKAVGVKCVVRAAREHHNGKIIAKG